MAVLSDAAATTALRAIRIQPGCSFSPVTPRVVNCNVSPPPASKSPAPPALRWQQNEASQHATTTADAPKEQLTSLSSLSAENLSSEQVIAAESQLILQTYARTPLVFVKGQGCWLTDAEGREYLDMTAGIAVNALGHGDVEWVRAITDQASVLTHVSNLYHTVPQIRVAERLVNASFAHRVFFANSGTEANEAAIKFARKYQRQRQQQPYKSSDSSSSASDAEAAAPTELVAFKNAFHGRTVGALALTSKVQYRTPFEPLMPGVSFVEYGDLEAVGELLKTGRVAAVFVEPVQGEGGVYPATEAFLRGLREVCDETGALLVFDEIQCGLGRTGTLWAHELYGVEPDIMTLAKPLAGGLPMGAVLMTDAVASAIAYGDHGSTFAGGPLVCTASLAVLDRLQSPGFLESVAAKGSNLRAKLSDRLLGGQNPHVKEIRGMGLLVGIQLDVAAGPVVQAAKDAGMILITAGKGDVIRLAPPLTISEEELNLAIDIIVKCLNQSL